jgi:hypothetical protein
LVVFFRENSTATMSNVRGTGPNANYFGDRPMSIQGKMMHERERLATEMTMEEREWYVSLTVVFSLKTGS